MCGNALCCQGKHHEQAAARRTSHLVTSRLIRMLQLLLRHGRLKMHRSQHPIPINSGGLWVVNNGLVKVTYTPNVGSEQQYFLGSGKCMRVMSYEAHRWSCLQAYMQRVLACTPNCTTWTALPSCFGPASCPLINSLMHSIANCTACAQAVQQLLQSRMQGVARQHWICRHAGHLYRPSSNHYGCFFSSFT